MPRGSPRDKSVLSEPRFLYLVILFAVSSRFWGAESKSDECLTGTLELFRLKPQNARWPPTPVAETVKNI